MESQFYTTSEKRILDVHNEEMMAVQTEMEIFVQMQIQIMLGLAGDDESEVESEQGWQPFTIEIEIENIDALITNCITKEPYSICQNMKDAHMNTIGEDYILTGMNKNAHVVDRATYNTVKTLDLKNREMSTSLVHNELLYIGTYVDTIFIFSIPDFERLQLVRTHDSVLSLCSISNTENRIVAGLAGGYVDVICQKQVES